MIIGIDIGGTNTHGVLMDGGRLLKAVTIEGKDREQVLGCFSALRTFAAGGFSFVLTGGGARKMRESDFSMQFKVIDEIESLGAGGMFLSGKRDIFVVSIGTGTAFVSVKGGKARHMGGTGVGGGTIHGLSKLMLGLSPDMAEVIAKGTIRHLDITVKDIVGGRVGRIPGDATASNFGKAVPGSGKPEIAASLLNMIAESIGVMAYFAAKTTDQEGAILVCGRVAINDIIKQRIMETVRMFGGSACIPKDAEYCAAIGAALLA